MDEISLMAGGVISNSLRISVFNRLFVSFDLQLFNYWTNDGDEW